MPDVISTKSAALLLNITERWLNKLANSGTLPQIARGKFSPAAIVEAYVNFKAAAAQRPASNASLDSLREIKRRREEMRIAAEERELYHIEEVHQALDIQGGLYLDSISRIASALTSDPRERERIEALVDQERLRLSDRFLKIGRALREGRPVDEASAEDNA